VEQDVVLSSAAEQLDERCPRIRAILEVRKPLIGSLVFLAMATIQDLYCGPEH
jgi:hypothetical protein